MTAMRSFSLEIVIVTKQRYSQLLECVNCICNNTLKPEGLIIVDSSSKQDKKTLQNISRLCNINSIRLTVINTHDLGISHSRNLGITKVCSTYFAFVDDDEYVPKNWCHEIFNFFRINKNYQVLCGPKIPKNLKSYWNLTWASIIDSTFTYSGLAQFVPSGNSCYVTSFIRKNRLFYDERFKQSGEDQVFYFNLINHKANCFFLKELFLYHDCRSSLIPFIKQWFSYGESVYYFYYLNFSRKATKKDISNISTTNFLFSFYPFHGNKLSIKLLPGLLVLNVTFFFGYIFSFFKRAFLCS